MPSSSRPVAGPPDTNPRRPGGALRYATGLCALSISTVAVIATMLALIFFYAPLEAEQGFLQKIFYIHVPLAIVALCGFVIGAVLAALHLHTRDSRWDMRSYVAIHMSLIFAVGALITGSIWAKGSWGHWWVWNEPTLVSFLIVFLLYATYQPLRFAIEDPERQARYASVFAITAGAFVPLNFIAVRLSTAYLHPRVLGSTSNLPPQHGVDVPGVAAGHGAALRHPLQARAGDQAHARAAARAAPPRPSWASAGGQPARGRAQRSAAPTLLGAGTMARASGKAGGMSAAALLGELPALPLHRRASTWPAPTSWCLRWCSSTWWSWRSAWAVSAPARRAAAGAGAVPAGAGAIPGRGASAGARCPPPGVDAGMSELLALGISHKTAPVALRERLAFTEPEASEFAEEATASASVREAVVISTCNRTEVYLVVGDPVRAESEVLGLLARRAGIRPTELAEAMYSPAQLRRRTPALPGDRGPGVDDRRARRRSRARSGEPTNRRCRRDAPVHCRTACSPPR